MTYAEMVAALEGATWTFAKTMPKNPHFWTARKKWHPATFEAVVGFIRDHGETETFWKKKYKVFFLNGWKAKV